MSSTIRNQSQKAGLPPGHLIHVGQKSSSDNKITVIDFNPEGIHQKVISSVDDIFKLEDKVTIKWVNIEGLSNIEQIKKIGTHFNIHELVLEDILNTNQRPKVEFHDHYIYIVLKRWELEHKPFVIGYEQISILILNNYIFTFKERPDNLFNPLINHLKTGDGILKSKTTDFLAYLILDTIIDEYFSLQEPLEDSIEKIDNILLKNPSTETLQSIQRIKRELIFVHKTVLPLREVINALQNRNYILIHDETRIYLHDLSDHIIRINEAVDSYRDIITGMLNIYLSSVNNRMNEVMKVLTIFASIFIPLTFLAGIYGMNFKFMPELEWRWGYPLMWGLFIFIPVSLLIYFKRKNWL
ncbi:MAG: magnesium/cobalt transporter CorA [Bacteroidales bacterium]|nr:magnesium/cobalt transporter CorA [Bacteroidales bacterium]